MKKIAVLGAGYMGSAITFPLSDNGYKINLWGTWLDDALIDSCVKGYHPKLKQKMPENVDYFYSKELKSALKDVDMVFMAVTSNGFVNVFQMVMDNLAGNKLFFKLTKGLAEYDGKIKRLAQAAEDVFRQKFGPNEEFYMTVIGGAVTACELAKKIPTVSIYAPNHEELASIPPTFATDYYSVIVGEDPIGVEISSAYKNVYSIMVGISDGIYGPRYGKGNYVNLNSFIYNQGLIEMSKIAEAAGGNRNTSFNLAGIADFYGAALSGRNQRYGEEVGKGGEPHETFNQLFEKGEVSEGYMALKISIDWIKSIDKNLISRLPLLSALHSIIFKNKSMEKTLAEFLSETPKSYMGQ
jgi:glycerol-3-phosphate dehydrogenase (NAD(P)+)